MKRNTVLIQFCFIFLLLSLAARAADSDKSQGPQSGALPGPESKIIEKWRGTWEVKAMRRQPLPVQEVTYVETFDWVLDGRYLRSETSRKSDGGKSMSMFWFDPFMKSYRWVLFDLFFAVELPAPTWSETTQTMEWEAGFFAPIAYTAHVTFKDPDTIEWKSLLKDWKGTVILDLEGTSVRRK